MKKIFTLLTTALCALQLLAVGTASDPYLNITNYATIDEAGATVDGMETIYKYTQQGTGYWLTVSNYGVMKTDETQNWFTNEVTDGDTGSQYTNAWTATDVFQGPSAYFGDNPAYSAKYKQPAKTQTFYVTFCTQVKQYAYHRSNSSYYIFKMEIFECTKNGDGSITDGTTPIETLQNSVIGTEVLTSQELDPEKVYKVVITNQYSYLYEIAFKTPGVFDGEITTPVAYDVANLAQETVTCSWSPCPGAKSYTVRISPAEFNGLVYRDKFSNAISGTPIEDWQSLDAYTDHQGWSGYSVSLADKGFVIENNGFLSSPMTEEEAVLIRTFQKHFTLKFKAKPAEGATDGQLMVTFGNHIKFIDISGDEKYYTFMVERPDSTLFDQTFAFFTFKNTYYYNPNDGGEEENHSILLNDFKVYLGDYSEPQNVHTQYITPSWEMDGPYEVYYTSNVTDTVFTWGPYQGEIYNSHFNYTNALYFYDVKSVYYDGQESDWSNKVYYVYGEWPVFLEDDDEPIVVPGDVDGDGEVNSFDITALYNFLLNSDDSAIVYGDQDGDGEITAHDITTVYELLLGN